MTPALKIIVTVMDEANGVQVAKEHTWTFANVDSHLTLLQKQWDEYLESYDMAEDHILGDAPSLAKDEREEKEAM